MLLIPCRTLLMCSPNQADANLGTTDPSYSQGIQDVAHTMPHLTQFLPIMQTVS